jgi:hypothetical protein
MKKTIDFTEPTMKKIALISQKEGHRTFTAAVTAIISAYYDQKYYSKYTGDMLDEAAPKPTAKSPKVELTPAQRLEGLHGLCLSKGGRVWHGKNNAEICQVPWHVGDAPRDDMANCWVFDFASEADIKDLKNCEQYK